MEFRKYQHVERIGTTEVKGLCDGKCYIFPKLDGTNSSLWVNDGHLFAGSRNLQLSLEVDNAKFYNWAIKQVQIVKFFQENPSLKLFGEWLVPHTIKNYVEGAWRKFYVFDVIEQISEDEYRYLPYDDYSKLLNDFNIDYVPPLEIIESPTYEQLTDIVDNKNNYLTEEGTVGEGIVVKRYDFVNQYGRVTWGKVVKQDFKEKHGKNKTGKVNIQEGKVVEESIAKKYVTEALVEKEFAKIVNETGIWSSKYIARLLNVVYYSVIKEESWNFVKEHREPLIDFKLLKSMIMLETKKQKPELF